MKNGIRFSIATKLILSFLLIIVMTSVIFTAVIVVIISNHFALDAQEQAREDLESAREVYLGTLDDIKAVASAAAERSIIREAVSSGNIEPAADELTGIMKLEELDVLLITDDSGQVLFRSNNPEFSGDDQSDNKIISTVMRYETPAASTTKITAGELREESASLSERARLTLANSGDGDTSAQTDFEFEGMMLAGAAPIFNAQNLFAGVVYGGTLLNGNGDFICEIKQAVYQKRQYDGSDIGFAVLYQDDVGILSCPTGSTAEIGSLADSTTFDPALSKGMPRTGRELKNDSWYITAYQPIRNPDFETVGVLQVGTLEQPFLDIRNKIIVVSMAITFAVALVAILFAYLISGRVSEPLKKLVAASRDVAKGNLDARVDTESMSKDELGELAAAFNAMASALKERDERVRQLTRTRIRRSERLALIGKLSANVAHELNNPLQGIVTYSHLLLERMPAEHPDVGSVQKIVDQAGRCKNIIRGLLDFSRQREPVRSMCDVNAILQECLALLVDQALFLNVEIKKEFEPELPLAFIDPSQMERVFVNMLINAAEAMDSQGLLRLTTRSVPAEQCIEVIFSDTGHGISEENLVSIFDPFFTTKEVGKGTGLGLAISYGIIKEHGSTVSVESEVGKGTTFTIRLPLMPEQVLPSTVENDEQVQLNDVYEADWAMPPGRVRNGRPV